MSVSLPPPTLQPIVKELPSEEQIAHRLAEALQEAEALRQLRRVVRRAWEKRRNALLDEETHGAK